VRIVPSLIVDLESESSIWEKKFDLGSERIREFVQMIVSDYEGSVVMGNRGVQTVPDDNVAIGNLYYVIRGDKVAVHVVFSGLYTIVNPHILLQSTHRHLDAYILFHNFPLHIQHDVVCHHCYVVQNLLKGMDLLFVV